MYDNTQELKKLAGKVKKFSRLPPGQRTRNLGCRSAFDPSVMDRIDKKISLFSKKHRETISEIIKEWKSILNSNNIDIHDMVFRFTL
jgi:hypothetical protein